MAIIVTENFDEQPLGSPLDTFATPSAERPVLPRKNLGLQHPQSPPWPAWWLVGMNCLNLNPTPATLTISHGSLLFFWAPHHARQAAMASARSSFVARGWGPRS